MVIEEEPLIARFARELSFPEFRNEELAVKNKSPFEKISPLFVARPATRLSTACDKILPEFASEFVAVIIESFVEKI